MGTDAVKVRWTGKRQFIGWDELDHGVVMDALPQYKGEGTGPSPIRLVLYGLAGCTAMDVVSILEKKRQDVRGLEVLVSADREEDEYPKIYTDVRLTYVVTGYDIDPAAVARAIELSETKYCSVSGMLSDRVKIVTAYEIVDSRQAGVPLLRADEDRS